MEVELKNRYNLKFNYIIYDDGSVLNKDNGRYIKPYNDPRRPNEGCIIYLKTIDNKRLCKYHDELMCESFIDNYDASKPIIHKDGDVYNCRLDNLYVNDPLVTLHDYYKEVKEWKKVELEGINLYYDYYICEDGRLYNGTTDAFVKPFRSHEPVGASNEGYLRYNLYTGKSINDVIHFAAGRLVAIHFIPKTNEMYNYVIYRDDDCSNVDKSNLYWGDNYAILMKHHLPDRTFCCIKDEIYGTEKWKPMKYFDVEFADEYIISNFGRIYNISKCFYVSQLNGFTNNYGQSYKSSMLYTCTDEGDKFVMFSIHRLVAYNFVKNKNPEINKVINHINGNPECNFSDNLEWCTPYYNIHHAIQTNLINNKNYIINSNNKKWKYYLFFGWAFATIKDLTLELCYSFYVNFNNIYHDMSDVTYEKFSEIFESIQDTEDYKNIKKFFNMNYT